MNKIIIIICVHTLQVEITCDSLIFSKHLSLISNWIEVLFFKIAYQANPRCYSSPQKTFDIPE